MASRDKNEPTIDIEVAISLSTVVEWQAERVTITVPQSAVKDGEVDSAAVIDWAATQDLDAHEDFTSNNERIDVESVDVL